MLLSLIIARSIYLVLAGCQHEIGPLALFQHFRKLARHQSAQVSCTSTSMQSVLASRLSQYPRSTSQLMADQDLNHALEFDPSLKNRLQKRRIRLNKSDPGPDKFNTHLARIYLLHVAAELHLGDAADLTHPARAEF